MRRQVASYEFTTLTCIPGVVRYRGAKIQLLDLPGIIEGAKDGKGRGRQACHPPLNWQYRQLIYESEEGSELMCSARLCLPTVRAAAALIFSYAAAGHPGV